MVVAPVPDPFAVGLVENTQDMGATVLNGSKIGKNSLVGAGALVTELRCVMCQNQSLADSNAEIARDLRHEVLELMRKGRTDAQIKQFLVARYGEFVLYRPRMEATTWLLWFGPALVLLAGGFLVAGAVRRRSARLPAAPDQDNQEW